MQVLLRGTSVLRQGELVVTVEEVLSINDLRQLRWVSDLLGQQCPTGLDVLPRLEVLLVVLDERLLSPR